MTLVDQKYTDRGKGASLHLTLRGTGVKEGQGTSLHLTLVDQNAFGEPEGQAVSQLAIDLFRKIIAVPIFYRIA